MTLKVGGFMYELLLQVPDGINLTAVLIVCSNSSDLDAIRCTSIEKKVPETTVAVKWLTNLIISDF